MRIEAAPNGTLMYVLDEGETQDIQGIGEVTGGKGGSSFSLGATSDTNRTQVSFHNQAETDDENEKMTVITNGDINDFEFIGENFDAKLKSKNNSINADAKNSTISSSQSTKVTLTSGSESNFLNLKGDKNQVTDHGDHNFTMTKGETTYKTGIQSENAVAMLGKGNDDVTLQGKGAFVYTGAGQDKVTTGENSEGNVVHTGTDNDVAHDKGNKNYFNTGSGNDTSIVEGTNGLIEMGTGTDKMQVAGTNNTVAGDLTSLKAVESHINKESWLDGFSDNKKASEWVNGFSEVVFDDTLRPEDTETKLSNFTSNLAKDIFDIVDTNKDGAISEDEMNAYEANN